MKNQKWQLIQLKRNLLMMSLLLTGILLFESVNVNGQTVGQAAAFDGINDHVVISPHADLNLNGSFSLEAWVHPNSPGSFGWDIIMAKLTTYDPDYWLIARNGTRRLFFGFRDPSGTQHTVNATTNLVNGVWYHVAGTYDGNELKIYINGYLEGSNTIGNIPVRVSPTKPLKIGWHGSTWQWHGKIDEARVWNKALCEAEIQARKNCELSGSESALVAYYQFNEGVAGGNNAGVTNLPDISGNGHNGTLTGFALNGTSSNWVAPGGVTTGTSCPSGVDCSGGANQDPDCSGAAIADQSADGNCQAAISEADVSGVTDPDGDDLTITVSPTVLDLGANTVTVTADDGNDGICSTDITVNVVDESDPVLAVSNDQLGMWPPNHKYKTFTVADFGVSVSDNCGCCVEATITDVTCNEPDDIKGGGDGNTKNDIVIVDDQTVKLRAERQGGGDGRVYTITLSATDGSGNTTQATCEVIVPQNRNGLPKGIGGFISDTDMASPEDYFLSQNYPNPFNPTTTISFGLPQSELVTLNIYNSTGQLIRTLTSGSYSAGNHNVTWDATDYRGVRVANGIYIYELKTSNYLQQRKMLLMK